MTKYKRKNKYIQQKKWVSKAKSEKRQINKNTNSSTFFYILFFESILLYSTSTAFLSITNAHSKEFLIISVLKLHTFFSTLPLCKNGRSASIDKMKIKKEWKFKKQIKKFFLLFYSSSFILFLLSLCSFIILHFRIFLMALRFNFC